MTDILITVVAIITKHSDGEEPWTLRDSLLSSPAHLNLLGRFILHPWVGNETPRGPRNGVCGSSFSATPHPSLLSPRTIPMVLIVK